MAEINELEGNLEALRVKFERYFSGLDRIPPLSDRDVFMGRLRRLQQNNSNTAVRFRHQNLKQRTITLQNYWNRVLREIEDGRYHRDRFKADLRAKRRAPEEPDASVDELDEEEDITLDEGPLPELTEALALEVDPRAPARPSSPAPKVRSKRQREIEETRATAEAFLESLLSSGQLASPPTKATSAPAPAAPSAPRASAPQPPTSPPVKPPAPEPSAPRPSTPPSPATPKPPQPESPAAAQPADPPSEIITTTSSGLPALNFGGDGRRGSRLRSLLDKVRSGSRGDETPSARANRATLELRPPKPPTKGAPAEKSAQSTEGAAAKPKRPLPKPPPLPPRPPRPPAGGDSRIRNRTTLDLKPPPRQGRITEELPRVLPTPKKGSEKPSELPKISMRGRSKRDEKDPEEG